MSSTHPRIFFLLEATNEKIAYINAAGLMKNWIALFLQEKYVGNESKMFKVLKMDHLAGCFQLWGIGLVVSLTIFMCELLKFRYSACDFKCKTNILVFVVSKLSKKKS